MKGSRGTFYTKLLGMFIATVLRAIYCYTGRLRDPAGGVVVTKGEVAAAPEGEGQARAAAGTSQVWDY